MCNINNRKTGSSIHSRHVSVIYNNIVTMRLFSSVGIELNVFCIQSNACRYSVYVACTDINRTPVQT